MSLATLPHLTCGSDACTRQTPSAEATARAQCASPTDLKVNRTSLKLWQAQCHEFHNDKKHKQKTCTVCTHKQSELTAVFRRM